MSWIRRLWFRMRRSSDVERTARDIEDELRFHVDMEVRDLLQQGVEPHEARRRALASFGGGRPLPRANP